MIPAPLAITGVGVRTAAGGLDGLWDSISAGRHHLAALDDGADGRPPRLVARLDEPLEGLFPRRIDAGASRHARLGAAAMAELLGPDGGDAAGAGLVFASASQGQDLAERVWKRFGEYDIRSIDQDSLRSLTNSGATQIIAVRYDLGGFVQSIDGASAAGLLALQAAAAALRSGLSRRVFVVAGEANVFPASLAFYEKKVLLGSVTHTFFGRWRDPEPRSLDTAIHPFGPPSESDRGAIGEAGAALCLETLEGARSRGAEVFALLDDVHAWFHADGYHGADRELVGLARVLEPFSGSLPGSIHLPVSGAWVLDTGVIEATSRVFPGAHAFSIEPQIGHCGAASSLLNIALAVRALQERIRLPTRGLDFGTRDPRCLLVPTGGFVPDPDLEEIVVPSCGWGGWNAAARIRRA